MAVRCAPCAAACAHPESPLRVLRACARVLHPARILVMLRFSPRAPPAPALRAHTAVIGADHYSTSYTSFAPALQLSAPVALSYSRKHMAIVPRNSSCNTLSISLHTFVSRLSRFCLTISPFSRADLPPPDNADLTHWAATATIPDLFTHHRSSWEGQRHRIETVHIPTCPSFASSHCSHILTQVYPSPLLWLY